MNPENRDRNRLARRKLIREYFEWVRRQEDGSETGCAALALPNDRA